MLICSTQCGSLYTKGFNLKDLGIGTIGRMSMKVSCFFKWARETFT